MREYIPPSKGAQNNSYNKTQQRNLDKLKLSNFWGAGHGLIKYPDLLERKYEELSEVKTLIKEREGELKKQSHTFGLERFKECSKKFSNTLRF